MIWTGERLVYELRYRVGEYSIFSIESLENHTSIVCKYLQDIYNDETCTKEGIVKQSKEKRLHHPSHTFPLD